jgi:hypothetical protein
VSTEAGEPIVWSELASDVPGILLFVLWLFLPPLYIAVLGRRYAARCEESAQEAVWAREELRHALEALGVMQSEELAERHAANSPGRHRMRADRSALLARASA